MYEHKFLASFGFSLALALGSTAAAGGKVNAWTQNSFEDFVQGSFGDGGANTYVSRRGRIQLINRWDLNQDGYHDLVFSNSHPHVEALDGAIYWGNGKDFDGSRVSFFPTDGSQWTVPNDLDGDGQTDIIVANYANGTWDGMDSYVYFGGTQELGARSGDSKDWGFYPFARKTSLPTRAAQNAVAGDINKDGHTDIVFALSAGFWEYRAGGARSQAYESPSRIFWGSGDGFERDGFTDIEAMGASDVALGDLNQDSWLDLVVANRERQGEFDIDSYLYWGGPSGFAADRRVALPTRRASAVSLEDINQDGYLDILFANGKGPVSFVYVSDQGDFRKRDRIELPTHDARDVTAADLNNDGAADILFTNHQEAGNLLTDSYLYWGGKDGFSAERRQGLYTVGAWGASIADLNEDGLADIVISNYKEHYSYDVPSYIYWNSKEGFSNSLRTSLFTRGAVGNRIADFNGDGHLDVVFNNTIGRSRGGNIPVFLYWGNQEGQYSSQQRLKLPAQDPYNWAAGDLDDDGWVDLVVANMDEVGRRVFESYVYWGSEDGFSESRRTALMGHATSGVSLADLDRDGYLDVVFFNFSSHPREGVIIYWGSSDGFATPQRTGLPSNGTGTPTVADLNSDGHLDLVTHSRKADRRSLIYWGNGTRGYGSERSTEVPGSEGTTNSEVADMNRDRYLDLILTRSIWQNNRRAPSYIYYGNAQGDFSTDRRDEFTTVGTQGVTVGDLNQDGWLDVACPAYSNGQSRATTSRVYLGRPEGLSESSMLTFPTNSGTGSQIADYNRDGFNDLLFVCHRSEGDPNRLGAFGDHVTDSYLYWGGPDGFKDDRRLLVPSQGAHYDSGVDLGNIYDRSLRWDYTSSPYHYGRAQGERLVWQAVTPHQSSVAFQVRTASRKENLEEAQWMGPQGTGTFYTRPALPLNLREGNSWIQYRAVLHSPHGVASPILEEVRLSFKEE